jgi:pimeloyl-ACP methyl ester carboxylesterase
MFGDSRRIPGGCLEAYRETLKIPGTMSHVLSIVHPWFQDMEKLRTRLTDVKSKPILLIWGDKDRVVSLESAKRMERELGAQLVVIPGGGHLVFEEFAEKVNAVMTEWLYGVRQRC